MSIWYSISWKYCDFVMIRTIEFSWEKILAYLSSDFKFDVTLLPVTFSRGYMFQINYCASKIVRVISPPPLGAHCIVTSQVVFLSSLQGYMLLSGLELWHWCSTRQMRILRSWRRMSKRSEKREEREMSGCEEEAVAVESHLQFSLINPYRCLL